MRTTWTRAYVLLAMFMPVCALAAGPLEVRREIQFPSLPGMQTLACDFHMHTVFSDGNVWPTVRVAEAWRLGLDVIAITDHIEYQPHKADLPTNFARSYDLAVGPAKSHRLLLIRAAEVTRDTPPGHFNALFLSDINPLDTPEFLDALQAAKQQDAFVFWNHHAWKGEEQGAWLDVHTTLFDSGILQGLEVANGETYYPTAHKWCLEKKLTMVGNSDIHDPDLNKATTSAEHRTMTLVLAKDRTIEGVKEALKAGRTIVWWQGQLIGREDLLRPFFEACVEVQTPVGRSKSSVTLPIRNQCAADIEIEHKGPIKTEKVVLPANSTSLVRIPGVDGTKAVEIACTAKNFLIGPNEPMTVTLKVAAP